MKTSNKFFAELFGTFVLVFGGCGTALFGHVGFLGVAIAFGLTVIAMAYGIGHISGAHLNPAVSFGVFVNGRMSFKEMLCYWAAQFIGGIIAGALLLVVFKAIGGEATGVFASNGYGEMFQKACGGPETGYQAISMGGAFLVECMLTFVFLMVILGVTDSSHANGKFGGLAIGLTLVPRRCPVLQHQRRLERHEPSVALHRCSARRRLPRWLVLQVPRRLLQKLQERLITVRS